MPILKEMTVQNETSYDFPNFPGTDDIFDDLSLDDDSYHLIIGIDIDNEPIVKMGR